MNKLLNIYSSILQKEHSFLINKETLEINKNFLLQLFIELKKREQKEWKSLQEFIQKQRTNPDTSIDDDNSLTEKQRKENKLSHLYMCNPSHPFFDKYINDFSNFEKAILSNDVKQFKFIYYSHFLDQSNQQYINREKKNMVKEYLASLKFTLLYYNNNVCPSYEWAYPYRSPPLFSDIVYFLEKEIIDINSISFRKGKVFSPLEQLMYILPRQSIDSILPRNSELTFIINKYVKSIDPSSIKVDALLGLKYIYSEVVFNKNSSKSSMRHDLQQTDISRHPQFQVHDIQ